jgi:hypothetical protein
MVMEGGFERGIFEAKALLLMLLFGFAGMALLQFEYAVALYGSFFGQGSFGLENFFLLIQAYSYLLNPVLLFIAFYRICGKNVPTKAASTIISLVVGTVVGALIGWLVVGGLFAMTTEYSLLSSFTLTVSRLQLGMLSDVLVAVAAVAWAMVVKRWDEMLVGPSQEWKHGRPFEIPVASAIYAVSGILTLCVLPILFILPFNTNPTYLALLAGVVFLVIIGGVGQLVIARGIYIGRRWGWLIAFVGSMAGLTLNALVLSSFALYQVKWDLLASAEAASASVSLLLSLVMLGLLLTLNSRLYCRMVDARGGS